MSAESALSALSKLDQVLPARLRSQVAAVHDATVTLTPNADSPVEPDVLMTLARACRDREHVDADYTDRSGRLTQRRLEPYQLVATGRRWYLLAYDRDKDDWRSLRLDRMSGVRARGTTFTRREAPDAAAYVSRAITSSPYRYIARVRYHCTQEVVAQHFTSSGDDRGRRSAVLHGDCRGGRSRVTDAAPGDGRSRFRGTRAAGGDRRRGDGGGAPEPGRAV